MLQTVDFLFVAGHAILIAFNLSGWAFRRTRRLHLVVIGLTIGSWVLLGLVYGFGYCPCTDWHWDVKRALGEQDLPNSWVKYYADAVSGMDVDAGLIDAVVGACGFGALALSVALNLRDLRRRRD